MCMIYILKEGRKLWILISWCFRSQLIWIYTVFKTGYIQVKVVGDSCQKITLLLLKRKSVRVIVPESCF